MLLFPSGTGFRVVCCWPVAGNHYLTAPWSVQLSDHVAFDSVCGKGAVRTNAPVLKPPLCARILLGSNVDKFFARIHQKLAIILLAGSLKCSAVRIPNDSNCRRRKVCVSVTWVSYIVNSGVHPPLTPVEPESVGLTRPPR